MSDTGNSEFLAVAIEAAHQSGNIVRDNFGKRIQKRQKGRTDIVTEIDELSQSNIISIITRSFADHSILSEEGFQRDLRTSPYRWIVDPLDGTTNFAHGHPYFAISIALQYLGDTIVAVVYDPSRNDTFYAEEGQGAYLNDRRIQTSGTSELIESLIATGFPYDEAHLPEVQRWWETFSSETQAMRCNGAAALDLCYVGAGRLDGFYEAWLGPWDCSAGALIVGEAGGKVSRFNGSSFDPFHGDVVASNGFLHQAMLAILQLQMESVK